MKLRSSCVLVMLVFAACGKTAEPPLPEPTPDPMPMPEPTPDPMPEPTPAIHGTLTVHLPGWEQIPPGVLEKVTVLLGDGSRFRQPIDAKGDARFVDAAIVGPQDVTVVAVSKTTPSFVSVGTVLAIDQPEVWLNNPLEPPPSPQLPPPPKLATVSGKVTGVTQAHPAYIFVASPGFSGGAAVNPDGTFRIDVLGAEPGSVDLVVREEDDANFEDPQVLRAGRLRGVALSRDQVLGGLQLALDQPVDQTLGVTVNGQQLYAPEARVKLTFFEEQLGFFSTSATGASPLSLRTLAMSAPFDTTRRFLSTIAGDSTRLPAGMAFALKRIDNGATASLTLPVPMSLSAPLLGACTSPSVTPRTGLALRWSIDATANVGQVVLEPSASSSGPILLWSVIAPASITSFTPFPLPAEVSPLATLPTGVYSVTLDSSFQSKIRDYASFFTQEVPNTAGGDTRTTQVKGCLELK